MQCRCGQAQPSLARRRVHRWTDKPACAFIVTALGKDVDPFTLHIYAALAEQERRVISQRTLAGLAAARERVSCWATANIGTAKREAARARDTKLDPILRELRHLSSREIAAELARRGHHMSYRTVQRAMARLKID